MADQTLGRFVLETPIGTGGMGVVYRAWDPDLHRRVAIKVLKDLDTPGSRASQDLLREARAASTLNHPNICTVHEVGRAEGAPFIVMEYVDGHSLRGRVEGGSLPEEVVFRYGAQIADALAHAHARDIVHRDLKTGNVMVTGDGLVKVLDFGLAFRGGKADTDGQEADPDAEATADATAPAGSGQVPGTLPYMAPELLTGAGGDTRSDIWSLGVVLYEMATGKLPFWSENRRDLYRAIVREPPPSAPQLSPPLRRIIWRCLEKHPNERYQTAREIRAALHAATSPPPARRGARIAVAAGLALLVGLAAFWMFREQSPGEPRAAAGARSVELALGPIVGDARDAELQMLALSVTDLLQARLAQVAGLRVHQTAPASGPASAAGPRYMVSGELRRTTDGGRGHLSLQLQQSHVATGIQVTPLGEYDIPFLNASTSLDAYVALRERIARRVVDSLSGAFDLPAGDLARPRNVEAYRLYLQAANWLYPSSTCDPVGLDLAKRSLAIDPEFTPVWELLGWAHYNRAAICGQGGTGYAEALAVAERALALSAQFDNVELLKVAVLVETGQIEEAYAYLQTTGPRAGRSPNLSFGRAYALTYAGYLGEASRALDVVTRLDPLFLTDSGWAPNALLHRGDVDGFLRLLPGTESAYFRLYRGLARLSRGEREAAQRAVSGAFDSNPEDVFARLALALNSILSGRPSDARARVLALARHRDALGSRDGEVTYKQAQLLALAGDHVGAIAELDHAVTQGFFCLACMDRSSFFDPLRTAPDYQRVRAAARTRHEAFGRRFGIRPE